MREGELEQPLVGSVSVRLLQILSDGFGAGAHETLLTLREAVSACRSTMATLTTLMMKQAFEQSEAWMFLR